LNPHAIAGNGF